MQDYPREQIIKLYKDLPQELKDMMDSEKEVEDVWGICERYKIKNKFSDIQKKISYVLLGLTSLETFKKYIEKEIAPNKDEAEKIYREIFRFVFFPVKDLLGNMYNIKAEKELTAVEIEKNKALPLKNPAEETKPKTKEKKDVYRELIE